LKNIKAEIERLLTAATLADRTMSARFVFPQDFIGFQGHFPHKKILAGACQIQCILSTIANGKNRPVALREVILAKYYAPVFPDEEVACTVKVVDEGDDLIVKACVLKGDAKVTEMKLRVSLVAGGGKQ
jgi:3-hydroxyacyl-[acyl-carrier-protein] dehydratase